MVLDLYPLDDPRLLGKFNASVIKRVLFSNLVADIKSNKNLH